MARIVVDPITRIEGHLRIDVEVEWRHGPAIPGRPVRCGAASRPSCEGRDPRDAWLFTQRFCGVCTTVHAITSVRTVENALNLEIPMNAQYIRNMILCAHAMHDHIVHFYHLSALDWVDVVSALSADPRRAAQIAQSLSDWPGNSVQVMQQTQARVQGIVDSGQLGIFANGYWGHPAMKLPPEVNLLAVAHYLQALDYQRKANQIVTILGSKTPNIQNLAVGGVANAINLDNEATLNMNKLYAIKSLLDEVSRFVREVYVPDVIAIGSMYPEWLGYGAGVKNYLSVPDLPLDAAGTEFDLPGGTIMNGDIGTVPSRSVRSTTSTSATTCRRGSPTRGTTATGRSTRGRRPRTRCTPSSRTTGSTRWVKSPRFANEPMQVGPLAQVLVGYASGHELTRKYVDAAVSQASSMAGVQLGLQHLHSTLGRHLARAVRTAVLAELAYKHWGLLVNNIGSGDTDIFNPPEFPIRGAAGLRIPRGAAWSAVPLGGDRQREDQELPGGRPVDLERRSARRAGPPGTVRSLADGQPGCRSGASTRGSADRALVRSVPGVRDPHPGSGGQGNREGKGPLTARDSFIPWR